ncbi:MAG: hypothetical protein J6K33_08050 [Alistipes sp.]|nr:hypothetical protein [Alistipes sp.]MBQ8853754.1 hypothetical protein [Alistipes sp.]
MKRVSLFLSLLLLTVGFASAKGKVSYQGEVDLGYSFGVGKRASERVNIHTIQGIKVGKYFSTGIGTGFDFYYDFDDSSEAIVPVYLNLKGYYPVSKNVSPFVSCDVGLGVGVTGDLDNDTGLTVAPAVGVVWGVFKAQVGYNMQKVKNIDLGKLSMSSVQVKIGIMF